MESTINPYASPDAELDDSPDLSPGDFHIGTCFSQAWKACWSNFPLWLGVIVVAFLITVVSAVTVIGYILVLPVIAWGMVYFLLNMLKGQAQFNDLFVGFKSYGKALGRSLLLGILFTLLSLVIQGVYLAGTISMNQTLLIVGLLIHIVGSFLLLRLYFAFFLMVDLDMGAIDAFGKSWILTQGKTLKVILFGLTSFLVILVGMLALGIGVFPATIIVYLMWTSAYRQLVGK